MHYFRWRRHGDPLVIAQPKNRLATDDFWQYVSVGDKDACWLWVGPWVQKTGYAQFGSRVAHRVAYELAVGPIPEGMTIDHLCFTPLCMNPEHLEVVTQAENVRRMNSLNRGRCRKGHVIRGLEDVYVRSNGRSSCRACMAVAQKRRRLKKGVVRSLV